MGYDELRSRWPASLVAHTDICDRLLAAYGGTGRGYHDLVHLTEVLDRVDDILTHKPGNVDRPAVVLAAWFHDAVYEGEADEERSAALAEIELAAAGLAAPLVGEVARLVRMTAHHRPDTDDVNGAVLSDADLGILAADPDRYAAYIAGVRHEYAAVSDAAFAEGRAAILRALLDKPTLFHTEHARTHWEAPARANVERELQDLWG